MPFKPENMKPIRRKEFIKQSALIAGGAITARWALNKNTHPVKIHCSGGKFVRDDDQEVPNIMIASYEYDDGVIIQNEVRSLHTNPG